ncbi:MAG: asparagine synthase C-terminal domain-containing protein, partial [Ginsengibacter sp.]
IKAFKPIPYLQEKNRDWPVYLMAYGHLPEPITSLRDVQPLPKGNYLLYNASLAVHRVKLFDEFTYSELSGNRHEVINQIQDTLQKAVARHLISDARIGIFLSGGIDSGIIALLANNNIDKQLNTLSVYFNEADYSEKKYQDLILQNLFCKHHQYLLKEREFQIHLPSIINAMDLPGCDGINTWFISKYAKENGLKAVLSGIGGDELYGGYPSFSRMNMALLLEKLPNLFLKAGKSAGLKKIRRLVYLSLGGSVGKYLFLRGQFVPNEIAIQLNADESEIWKILRQQPVSEDISDLTPHNQASWIEMNMYMQNQLLRDADVMSMAHGVEIRLPFLDKEFVTLSLQIQSSLKYDGQLSKQLLIDSFKDILPEPVWNRPKMGFAFPFKEWMENDEYVKDCFMSNGEENIASFQNFIKGNLHWSQLMTLLLLEEFEYVG